jgi:hypothetical protein
MMGTRWIAHGTGLKGPRNVNTKYMTEDLNAEGHLGFFDIDRKEILKLI